MSTAFQNDELKFHKSVVPALSNLAAYQLKTLSPSNPQPHSPSRGRPALSRLANISLPDQGLWLADASNTTTEMELFK